MIINVLKRWFCQNTSITIAKTSSLSQRSIRKDLSVLEAGANETGGLIVQVAQAAAASYQLPVRLDTSVMEEHAALFNNTVTLRK